MGGVADIARHFGLKAVYVLVAWGVTRVLDAGRKKVLQRRARRAADTTAKAPEPGEPRRTPRASPARYKIYHNPNTDYKPSNPGWLRDAASLDPGELSTDLSWQCPQLIAFQAKVASQQSPWGPPLPAPQQPLVQLGPPIRNTEQQQQPATGADAPSLPLVSFGRQARKQLFTLDPGVTYLNHGSYGAAFRLALEVQSWYQQQLESQPVAFMETVALKGLVAAAADAARFVGASPKDVVPVVNATTAVNAVLDSIPLRRGDWVLMLNTTYPAVKSTVARVAAAAGASVIEVQLGLEELSRPAFVVGAVQDAMKAVGGGRRIKLAVLDHVVSFPPVVLPISELVAVLKQAGATVLVDGAHAVGNVLGLQVASLGADFYTTNLHKWACSPKGAALLWAAPERQAALHPVVTSHGYHLGFRGEFLWQGTADPSAWLAVPAALAVLRALGPERLALHNAALVSEAASLLRRRWESSGLAPAAPTASLGPTGAPAASTGAALDAGHAVQQTSAPPPAAAAAAPATTNAVTTAAVEGGLLVLGGGGGWGSGGVAGMLAVQLPPLREYGTTTEDAGRLHWWLRNEKSIEVPVVAAWDRLWVRISAQIYNELADYDQLATAVDLLRR